MGDRARVANVVEIDGILYAQVECLERGRMQEYLGAIPLRRIPKERQRLLLRGLRDFILDKARGALKEQPHSDHAKILGALSVLIGKLPIVMRDRLPEITVYNKVFGGLFGFAFYAPEKRRDLLSLYQPFATDKTVSGMAFLLEMEKYLLDSGVLSLDCPSESTLQISVNIRGRMTGNTFRLTRKSSLLILNRGARRNRRNPSVYQYWLLRALNRELFPNEDRTYLQRITQEEETLQREALVQDFLQEMGVESTQVTLREEAPLMLTEIEGEALVSALEGESFQETLRKEETFESTLQRIVETVFKQVHKELDGFYRKGEIEPMMEGLKRLMTSKENALNAIPLLRLVLDRDRSQEDVRDSVMEFLTGTLLSKESLGHPQLYEEAVCLVWDIKGENRVFSQKELFWLLSVHKDAYNRVGPLLEDVYAESQAVDALDSIRKTLKRMVGNGKIKGCPCYDRALGLVKLVTIKLDQADSLEEGVWFVLEAGFKDQAEAQAQAASASSDVIEEAPPVEVSSPPIDEDILKAMIGSSRYSHLSKRELLTRMSAAGGLKKTT